MKVIKTALRDTIFDFDGALDILLVGQLHLAVILLIVWILVLRS